MSTKIMVLNNENSTEANIQPRSFTANVVLSSAFAPNNLLPENSQIKSKDKCSKLDYKPYIQALRLRCVV